MCSCVDGCMLGPWLQLAGEALTQLMGATPAALGAGIGLAGRQGGMNFPVSPLLPVLPACE